MVQIAPTITAYDPHQYRSQMERIQPFAQRVHIDLMDGVLAPTQSPKLETIWWPPDMVADIHLMYQQPMDYMQQLISLKPRLVIIHYEATVHHMHFAAELHKENILAGLAILQDTPIEQAFEVMHSFDHVLIFSGHLGHHGGTADLQLVDKVREVREQHPETEIGWDGGVNESNILALVQAGVNVINVGGFIQQAPDPEAAYGKLLRVING